MTDIKSNRLYLNIKSHAFWRYAEHIFIKSTTSSTKQQK